MAIGYLGYECRNEIDKELKSEKNLPNLLEMILFLHKIKNKKE